MHGFPISYTQWAERFESDTRIIGKSDIDGIMISTVWLGMRHGTDDEGNPYVFETLVFNSIGEDIYMERYTSLQDAMEGHLAVTQKYLVEALKFRFGAIDSDKMFEEIDRFLEDGK
jgi:hypothetical protein